MPDRLAVLVGREPTVLRADEGETIEDATRRECEEEVAIAPERITIHGRLPESWNGAGFRIVPVVASVRGPIELRPQAEEVSPAATPLTAVVADRWC